MQVWVEVADAGVRLFLTSEYQSVFSYAVAWRHPPVAASGYKNGGFRFLKSHRFQIGTGEVFCCTTAFFFCRRAAEYTFHIFFLKIHAEQTQNKAFCGKCLGWVNSIVHSLFGRTGCPDGTDKLPALHPVPLHLPLLQPAHGNSSHSCAPTGF